MSKRSGESLEEGENKRAVTDKESDRAEIIRYFELKGKLYPSTFGGTEKDKCDAFISVLKNERGIMYTLKYKKCKTLQELIDLYLETESMNWDFVMDDEWQNYCVPGSKEAKGLDLDFTSLNVHQGYYELSFGHSERTTTLVEPTFTTFLTSLACEYWDKQIRAERLANHHAKADQLRDEQDEYRIKIRQRLIEISFSSIEDLAWCKKEGCGETDPEAWEYLFTELRRKFATFKEKHSLAGVMEKIIDHTRLTTERYYLDQQDEHTRGLVWNRLLFDTKAQNFINKVAEFWYFEDRNVEFNKALENFGSMFGQCEIIPLTVPMHFML